MNKNIIIDEVEKMKIFCDDNNVQHSIGYIYVLKVGDMYKIGKSVSPRGRIGTLKTACPFEIEVFAVYKTIDLHRTEKMLHDVFSEKRIRGEWFKLDKEDLSFFDREDDNFLHKCYL